MGKSIATESWDNRGWEGLIMGVKFLPKIMTMFELDL